MTENKIKVAVNIPSKYEKNGLILSGGVFLRQSAPEILKTLYEY